MAEMKQWLVLAFFGGLVCLGFIIVYLVSHTRSTLIWGRPLGMLLRRLKKPHKVAWDFTKTIFLVKQPVRFLRQYITLPSTPLPFIEFRNGTKLYLSNCPEDVVTVFQVFVKRVYGSIRKGSEILDIGANIGAYSIYAMRNGASRVYAYEPSRESYALLQKNIEANGFQDNIITFRLAVSGKDGEIIASPVESSCRNKTFSQEARPPNSDLIPTTSLGIILIANELKAIDCVKIDCEGAEYAIVLESPDDLWRRIGEVRMEYHRGRKEDLVEHLSERGYRLVEEDVATPNLGNLWFQRGC